ncbi:hypothetical protein HK405_002088, partial [Cladochytrium tenue]
MRSTAPKATEADTTPPPQLSVGSSSPPHARRRIRRAISIPSSSIASVASASSTTAGIESSARSTRLRAIPPSSSPPLTPPARSAAARRHAVASAALTSPAAAPQQTSRSLAANGVGPLTSPARQGHRVSSSAAPQLTRLAMLPASFPTPQLLPPGTEMPHPATPPVQQSIPTSVSQTPRSTPGRDILGIPDDSVTASVAPT